jgi:hypothetical protein
MVHLSIPRHQGSKPQTGMETYIAYALVAGAALLFLTAMGHHAKSKQDSIKELMASTKAPATKTKVAKAPVVNLSPKAKMMKAAAHSATTRGTYPVHLRINAFDTLMPDKQFPILGKMTVDGKTVVFNDKSPHYFDLNTRLPPGRHIVMLMLWNKQRKEIMRRYPVSVGPGPAKSKATVKVAQNNFK